jgi:hypothetical protein
VATNLVPACHVCNYEKAERDPGEWFAERILKGTLTTARAIEILTRVDEQTKKPLDMVTARAIVEWRLTEKEAANDNGGKG